jgi:hypothetical protein
VSAKTGLPVVVEFWVPWCGPHRMSAPAFAQAARQLLGQRCFLGYWQRQPAHRVAVRHPQHPGEQIVGPGGSGGLSGLSVDSALEHSSIQTCARFSVNGRLRNLDSFCSSAAAAPRRFSVTGDSLLLPTRTHRASRDSLLDERHRYVCRVNDVRSLGQVKSRSATRAANCLNRRRASTVFALLYLLMLLGLPQ